jgi:hypothetical protein
VGWFRKPRPDLVRTVRQDWHAPLTGDKNLVYGIGISTVTWSYDIFGMELNEGLASLRRGHAEFAREHAVVSAHLCDRFVHPLAGLISALEQHARHYGTLPSVEPLHAENFQGDVARRAASLNDILSQLLWRHHLRFLHKLRTLSEITFNVSTIYRNAVERVSEGSSLSCRQDWDALECAHLDLGTAFSEATVLLKCFLVALPDQEVKFFGEQLAFATSEQNPALNRRAPSFRRQ